MLLAYGTGCRHSASPGVMATVNGKEILSADLDKKVANFRASQGNATQQLPAEQLSLLRLQILGSMIDDEILQQRATKFNLVASDEDVNAKLNEWKVAYTQEQFEAQLKQHNQTIDDLKRDLRHSLTQTKLINKEIESKITITDSDISAYFEQHKAEYNNIEPQYQLGQIVVSSVPAQQSGNLQNNKANNDAEARRKIQALHSKLQNGEDFGAVAMNFSENQNTAPNGGDMGPVPESQLKTDAEVYAAISKLQPGQITDILPVNGGDAHHVVGYVIFKLIDKQPAGQRGLNDPRLQQGIRQILHNMRAQLLRQAYMDSLRSEAKVHNYLADQVLKQSGN